MVKEPWNSIHTHMDGQRSSAVLNTSCPLGAVPALPTGSSIPAARPPVAAPPLAGATNSALVQQGQPHDQGLLVHGGRQQPLPQLLLGPAACGLVEGAGALQAGPRLRRLLRPAVLRRGGLGGSTAGVGRLECMLQGQAWSDGRPWEEGELPKPGCSRQARHAPTRAYLQLHARLHAADGLPRVWRGQPGRADQAPEQVH